MNKDIADLRENYTLGTLDLQDVSTDAIEQFMSWFEEAREHNVIEANAMTLSTIDQNGHPDARTVLLKSVDHRGFSFFTNYNSVKSDQLKKEHHAHLLFMWLPLQRQVRIKGAITSLSREENETYFHSRPRESQIGAWASPQSSVIPDRAYLERMYNTYNEKFKHTDLIPLPDCWGGYLLDPTSIEFWQGRASRLHDRLLYTRDNNEWQISRLAP